jgi:mannosyltransferase
MTELTRQQPPAVRDTPSGGPGRWAIRGTDRALDWLLVAGPALVALVSYGYRLGGPPLWRDEATTKDMAGRSMQEILATVQHFDAVHGAYYLLLHFTVRVTGDSNAALRLPSMLAMVVACVFTALAARRLAAAAGAPRPWFTGITAGLALALLPGAVRYAQEARSFAIVTMCAAIATYLLTRAATTGRWWWAWYGAVLAVLGVLNIFGLLILVAHGLSLIIARRGRLPAGWLAAAAFALLATAPVLRLAYAQRAALTWKSAPPIGLTVVRLIRFWSGSWGMAVLVCVLAAIGIAAAVRAARTTDHTHLAVGPVVVGLPLVVVPALVLLAVSQAVPVYDNRYVEFCLPGLAILIGGGLSWLLRLAGTPGLRRARIGWLPVVAASAALLVLSVSGGALVRQPGARGDNLELATQVIAQNARAGDIVLFVPMSYRTAAMPFPGPWRTLRDIALKRSPARSNTLYGVDVTPARLRARFWQVGHVWLITPPPAAYALLIRQSPLYAAEARLVAGLRVIHRWVDHDVIITLYTAWHPRSAAQPGSTTQPGSTAQPGTTGG